MTRLLPDLDSSNRPFWTGGADRRLLIDQCDDCSLYIHPPAPVCRRCSGRKIKSTAVSGRGHLFSYTVNHQRWMPDLEVPYIVGLVELVEQTALRLTSNIVEYELLRIGMPLQVMFEQQGTIWVPLFRPA
ncbi:MAG: Zn-ribbon domain-containing OB-fold protein [Sphingorhabdus sp.]